MAFDVDFKRWRFNPITGVLYPFEVSEVHIVAAIPEIVDFGITTNEGIYFENPSSVVVQEILSGDDPENPTGPIFTEVPRSTNPSTEQYSVDYNSENYFDSGFIRFNEADQGRQFLVTYKGTGTLVKDRYQLNQVTVIPTNLGVEGGLEVTELACFLDDIQVDGNINVGTTGGGGDITALNDITAGNDVSAGHDLVATRDTVVGRNLEVTEDATVQQDLTVIGSINNVELSRKITALEAAAPWGRARDLSATPWSCVSFGNDWFVAMAFTGANRAMRSNDQGKTWSLSSSPPDSNAWRDVAFGNGVFVGVSNGGTFQVNRSTDNGDTWSSVSVASGNWFRIAYGNGVFIALPSTGGSALRSTNDGASFSVVALPVSSAWRGIAYDTVNGRWVIGGSVGNFAWSDDDGLTWDNTGLSVAVSMNVRCLAFDPVRERFSALSEDTNVENQCLYSDDGGETWLEGNTPHGGDSSTSDFPTDMVYISGIFIACSQIQSPFKFLISPDGINWILGEDKDNDNNIMTYESIAADPLSGAIVAVASGATSSQELIAHKRLLP